VTSMESSPASPRAHGAWQRAGGDRRALNPAPRGARTRTSPPSTNRLPAPQLLREVTSVGFVPAIGDHRKVTSVWIACRSLETSVKGCDGLFERG
jgi:hypothetical protein